MKNDIRDIKDLLSKRSKSLYDEIDELNNKKDFGLTETETKRLKSLIDLANIDIYKQNKVRKQIAIDSAGEVLTGFLLNLMKKAKNKQAGIKALQTSEFITETCEVLNISPVAYLKALNIVKKVYALDNKPKKEVKKDNSLLNFGALAILTSIGANATKPNKHNY